MFKKIAVVSTITKKYKKSVAPPNIEYRNKLEQNPKLGSNVA